MVSIHHKEGRYKLTAFFLSFFNWQQNNFINLVVYFGKESQIIILQETLPEIL